MRMSKAKATQNRNARLLQVVVLLLIVLLLVPQVSNIKRSVSLLGSANVWWVVGAVLVFTLTYVWATVCYKALSFKKLSFTKTLVVQWAGGFANKLVPAGLGSLSLNTLYLVKQGNSQGHAGTIALVNNALGWLSSTLLLVSGFLFWDQSAELRQALQPSPARIAYGLLGIILIYVGAKWLYATKPRVAKKINEWKSQALHALKQYVKKPSVLCRALCAQLLITATYCVVLIASAMALNISIDFVQALFVVSFGVALGSSIPTPGGIGGVEAGMVVVLTLLDIPTDMAIAIAFLFRLATFWLPLIPGYVAYRYSLVRKYYT